MPHASYVTAGASSTRCENGAQYIRRRRDLLRGFPIIAFLQQPQIIVTGHRCEILWCRGPDSNRQAVRRRIFVTPRLSTPCVLAWTRVRALDYAFAVAKRRVSHAAPGLRRPPSSLYTFLAAALRGSRLGSALPRRLARNALQGPGGSPNLRGSAPAVSGRALNRFLSPLCLPISSPRQGGRDSTIARRASQRRDGVTHPSSPGHTRFS